MSNGYVRQSSGVMVNGNTANASDFNNEFNALQSAFDASTGHTHDGTSGGGAALTTGSFANNSVTLAKIQTMTGLSILGNNTNTSANVAIITGTANQVLVVNSGGTSLGFGAVNVASSAAVTGVLVGTNGGTGVNNGTSTITIGGNVTFSGAHNFTGTLSADTTVTFPTSGTLAVQPSGTANTPLFNNGSGGFTNGTRSGNTTVMGSVSGSLTSGNILKSDASGNLVDGGIAATAVTTQTGTLTSGNLVKSNGTQVLDAGIAASAVAQQTGTLTSGNLVKSNGTQILDAGITAANVLTTTTTATLTTGFTFTPNNIGTITTGTVTPSAANGNYQYYTNNGAHTLAAPAADSAIDILITNGVSAGAITFSGFTVSSNTGDALTTTSTNKFILSIRRINAVATYMIKALQ